MQYLFPAKGQAAHWENCPACGEELQSPLVMAANSEVDDDAEEMNAGGRAAVLFEAAAVASPHPLPRASNVIGSAAACFLGNSCFG